MIDSEIAAADAGASSARTVLMVRPAAFSVNPQTAASNLFQRQPGLSAQALQARVLQEFDQVQSALVRAGVEVVCVRDTPDPAKPDAVFPNNWVTFHADGSVILYPMAAANRRFERRPEVLETLRDQFGFHLRRVIDLSAMEQQEQFLEGTGSLALDRRGGVAYAGLSARTRPGALKAFAERTGYRVEIFNTVDVAGIPVYHTNVMLSIGGTFAVLCTQAIADQRQREVICSHLAASDRDLVEISLVQMAAFAGNLLELDTVSGPVLVISSTALASLTPRQLRALERHGRLLPVTLPHIEVAGGSIRCMLAEIFLPRG